MTKTIPLLQRLDRMEADIAALKAEKAEAAKAAIMDSLSAMETPVGMFDPSRLAEYTRENEPHAEQQARWQRDYNQLTNRLVDTRLPPLGEAERRYQGRLQAALYTGRTGAIETL